jgi:hypothetical protein
MHALCGSDGSSEKDIHCGFYDVFGTRRAVKNALIPGITFVDASPINVGLQASLLRHRHRYHRKLWSTIEDVPPHDYDNSDSSAIHLVVTKCVFLESVRFHFPRRQ